MQCTPINRNLSLLSQQAGGLSQVADAQVSTTNSTISNNNSVANPSWDAEI